MSPRRSTLEDYESRILLAEQFIAEQLDGELSPGAIASAASFSLHHFHRIFRAQRGETVMQHVRRLRLERAARRLRATEDDILAVALDAGYDSHEAFTRAFVERFGEPPSVFREHPSLRLVEWQRSRADGPAVEVRVETFPPIRIAFMRSRGGYDSVGVIWEKFVTWARDAGVLGPLYGICPDDPSVTPEDQLRFDACTVIDPGFVPDPPVAVKEIPAGTYAVGLHCGPYHRLSETYDDVIGRWFPTSGYELAPEPVVEHYLNDPSQAAPDELRTEVRVMLAQ